MPIVLRSVTIPPTTEYKPKSLAPKACNTNREVYSPTMMETISLTYRIDVLKAIRLLASMELKFFNLREIYLLLSNLAIYQFRSSV